ncbi:MAG: hypothetical protein P8129_23390 [Anaerolineae bacterium]
MVRHWQRRRAVRQCGAYQVGFTLAQDSPPLVSAGSGYQVVQGYWSGAGSAPTAVTLAGFWIEARGDALVACWETASELDALGFSLYRSDTGEPDSFVRLNEGLIPSQVPGSPSGATYEWIDAGAEAGQTYYYLLEDVDIRGRATRHGPVPATLPPTTVNRIYLPYVNR